MRAAPYRGSLDSKKEGAAAAKPASSAPPIRKSMAIIALAKDRQALRGDTDSSVVGLTRDGKPGALATSVATAE